MAVYVWEGRIRGGKTQKGEMEAPSKSAVITRLRQMQIHAIPEKIKEKGKLFRFNLQFGGVPDTILQRLSAYLEKMENLKRRIRGAMVYPAVVITVAIIVLSIIMIFVVPVFAELFKDLGTTLPALTQFIVNLSTFFKNNIVYILIAVALLSFSIAEIYRRSRQERKIIDAFFLKIWKEET